MTMQLRVIWILFSEDHSSGGGGGFALSERKKAGGQLDQTRKSGT